MVRKVCDHIRKNQVRCEEIEDDAAAFVMTATSNRRPAPAKQASDGGANGANSNPFGGFQVCRPERTGNAQGGSSRQKAARPRFVATTQFAAMPTTAFVTTTTETSE